MNHTKNIVVSVSLSQECFQELLQLKDSDLLNRADNIYFIHIYNKRSHEFLPSHIQEGNLNDVEEYVTEEIHKLRNYLIPDHQNITREPHSFCLFHGSEKVKVLDYLDEVNADLIIAPTRGKQGIECLFQDSFCFWLVEHAPCDVLVIRPEKKVA